MVRPSSAYYSSAVPVMNEVVQGDCLEVLGGLEAGCVDLLYADPPFATGKDWGEFDDRWEGGLDGYLDYMRPRLEACRRVLAETGSFWLHCDWRTSHHLRLMLDELLGADQFRNEIVWCYAPVGRPPARSFHRKHDTILYYARPVGRWEIQYAAPTEASIARYSTHADEDGREWGPLHGRRMYVDDYQGRPVPDWWDDIPNGSGGSPSDSGLYPTQKPVRLLERIIRAATAEGDVVADPFCGSGTSLVAAKRLGRRWFGCDVNAEAVRVAEGRLAASDCVYQREMF